MPLRRTSIRSFRKRRLPTPKSGRTKKRTLADKPRPHRYRKQAENILPSDDEYKIGQTGPALPVSAETRPAAGKRSGHECRNAARYTRTKTSLPERLRTGMESYIGYVVRLRFLRCFADPDDYPPFRPLRPQETREISFSHRVLRCARVWLRALRRRRSSTRSPSTRDRSLRGLRRYPYRSRGSVYRPPGL